MLKLWKPAASSHEDLFLERYQRLLLWSLKLPAHDRQLAEDLLHDAFVQFTLSRPELETIRDLDSYLYAMVRNSHISHLRRALNVRTTLLSMVEFDSLEVGLRVTDVQDQIKVQDELRLICHYAALRKESSKGGSVLILRFFHGYYPSEIAQVLRSNWMAVTKWLQRARNEAALYLEDAQALSFIKDGPPQPPPQLGFARSTDDLLGELRQMIAAAKHGDCLSPNNLRELYRRPEAQPIDHTTLGHLVSCSRCHDSVNRLLGLPLLNQRYPTDMNDRDKKPKGPGDGPTPPSGADNDQSTRAIRRVKETFEHRPKELRIAVNGFLQVSQKVSSDRMEQTLSLDLEEKPDFVEVFSEQWIRLLFLDIEPPLGGAFEQHRRIELSQGRSLAATINFSGPCPDLHVVYDDPTLVQLQSAAPTAESSQVLDGDWDDSVIDNQVEALPTTSGRFNANLKHHWSHFSRTFNFGLFLRPGAVTALFALILIASLLLYLRVPTTTLSATELLRRSTVAEESIVARANQVVHRTISLEERITVPGADRGPHAGSPQGVVDATGPSSQLLSRRRIELWQNATQQTAALRVYDEKNQLVNGRWTKGGASRVLLHHGSKLQPAASTKPSTSSLAFSDTWQLLPAAQTFTELIERSDRATFTETPTEYTVSYQRDGATVDGLLRATLILNRPDLRAIKQTLLVKQGNEVREYVFSESSFEQRPASAVAPAIFEPDPELLSSAKPETLNPKLETGAASSLPLSPSPVAASPELEVEVVRQLNQVNAFLGEQISVERTAEGQLKVKGIVDSDERKNELLQSLSAFKANPAVKIDIATVAEAVKRQKQSPSGPVTVAQVESGKAEIPVEAELRQYFSKRGVGTDQLDQEVQRFSARVLSHSFQARRHALAVKQIAERFSLDDLRALDPQAKANWRAMLAQHARALLQETASLRRELESAFPSLASGTEGGVDVTGDEALVRAAQRLFAVAVNNDDSTYRSFAVFAGKQGNVPVKTPQFWQSLANAERLAQAIQNRER